MDYKDIPTLPGVYRIYFSEKSYIGASIDIKSRIWKHVSYLRRNMHSNSKLQRAYNLTPMELKFEVLEVLGSDNREILLDRETYYHHKYDSVENGYNFDLPRVIKDKYSLSPIQIEKAIRKSCKPIYSFDRFTGDFYREYGSLSDAAKLLNTTTTNISSVCKGKLNYHRNLIFCYKSDYDNSKVYKFESHYKTGKKISDKYRMSMRQSSTRSKPVFVYDSNNILVEKVSSIRYCEEKYGFKYDMLRYKLDRDIQVNGFYFKRKEINN